MRYILWLLEGRLFLVSKVSNTPMIFLSGVFLSVWDSVRSVCRRTAASLALLLTLVYKHMLLKKHLDHEGSSVLHWILAVSREAMASAVLMLNLGLQVSRRLGSQARHAVLHSWDNCRWRPAHGGIGELGIGGTEY